MRGSLRTALAAVVLGLCALPFCLLGLLSLAKRWPAPDLWPTGLTLERWSELLGGRSQLGASLAVSLLLSSCVATISTVCGYITSKHVAFHRHRRKLLLLAYVPFAMSPVILGTCLLYVYIRLHLAGGFPGVVLAQAIFAYGFAIVFFMGFWTAEKKALEELVYTLGGSTFQLYRRVLLPVARPMLLLCLFQTFLISWFDYGLVLLIGAGKVKTLTVKVYDYVGEANIYYAALASCLLVLPPALGLLLNRRSLFKAV